MNETAKKTLYDICGVEGTATADQIKRAYRAKANELHPDKTGGDDSEFKELALAYSIISDPERRSGGNTGYGGG
jgi:molecular chaperone DnaJ